MFSDVCNDKMSSKYDLDIKSRPITHELMQQKREDIDKLVYYEDEKKEIIEIYDRVEELIDDRIIYLDRYEDSKSTEDLNKILEINKEMQTLMYKEIDIWKKIFEKIEKLNTRDKYISYILIFIFIILICIFFCI